MMTFDYGPGSVLLCDVDGVVFDSYRKHLMVTWGLLSILGDSGPITSRHDEKQRFALTTLTERYGVKIAEAIIAARPALMAATVEDTPVIGEMVDVVTSLGMPVILITAGHASAVIKRLGADARRFEAILGCEVGPKEELFSACAKIGLAYITDTVSDVRKCQTARIRTIGVSWGFDLPEDLLAEGANTVVRSPEALRELLTEGTR